MRFFQKTRGAVSIFLVLILVPMMTMSALFVDAGKVKLARGVAESAGDLALNTALTNYDTMLKDMYGLFATAQDTEELFTKLEDYYRTCITSSGVSSQDADGYVDQIMAQLGLLSEEDNTSDILNMELVDFTVSKRSDASLANATVMKKQIVDFMKYRAPINTGLSFISSIQSFTTLNKQTELVDKRQEYYKEQQSVMENAQQAWKHINNYNKKGFITSSTYFSGMNTKFDGYESSYKDLAKKIIKDLYDTQDYDTFSPYIYEIVDEEVEIDDDTTKVIPIFYTNSAKTSKKTIYIDYSTYSSSATATAENIRTALINYNNAYNTYKANEAKLLEYDTETYGLQYLVQTNRGNLYKNWVISMSTYYEKYSELRHAVTYAGKTDTGASVMTVTEALFGEEEEKPYSYYYDLLMDKFDPTAVMFNQYLPQFNSTLQSYANEANTDKTATEETIAKLYDESTAYRTAISDAKSDLEAAVTYLGYVYEKIKEGGTLDTKKGSWKTAASDSSLSNTSMAKQDLAEIDSLSTYLNPTDVQKLIDRLNNIISHLGDMLTQIDSYTFFGTKIVEISDYATFVYVLETNIGQDALKSVPTNTTELENQVASWCDSQFVVGQDLDVSWENQSGTQAKLSGGGTDKLNFYSYLYTHFNTGTVSDDTTEKTEDEANGKNMYDSIKNTSSSAASDKASGADDGTISNSNELANLTDRPSKNAASSAGASSASISTGEDATKKTSDSLGSMFSGLASAVVDLGTDLRDKLYVSDYIMSMFSYDTIEKEFAVNNPGKDVVIESLTINKINADNNYAYGKEVEYIIYGGTNSSNLTKAYGSIYGIRFGFNLVYAFMSSEIRDTAFAIATPISAATLGIIPVPLIQAVIIIGIACCESAFDLNDIKDGNSVPLFKNSDTWRCSITGLINEAKGVAGDILNQAKDYVIDEGAKKITDMLNMTNEELTKYLETNKADIDNYIEDAYNEIVTQQANVAIQKLTTLANNALEEYAVNPATDMTTYVSNGLDAWLADEAVGVDVTTDIGYIVKREAVNVIKSEFIDTVITAIQTSKQDFATEVENMGSTLKMAIDSVRIKIIDKVNAGCDAIDQYKTEMFNSLNEAVENGAESFKQVLGEKIDGLFETDIVAGAGNSTNSTGLSSLLSFSYSDYLRLFLMIGLYTNEEGVLLRTADVIQANMSKVTSEDGYRLAYSAVYVEIDATIQVKPTLLALPLFSDVEGNPMSSQDWYTFKYHSIKGY